MNTIKNCFTQKNYYYFNKNNELCEKKLFVLQRIIGKVLGFYQETARQSLIDKAVHLISDESNQYSLEQINSLIETIKVVSNKMPFLGEVEFSYPLYKIDKQNQGEQYRYEIRVGCVISQNHITLKFTDFVYPNVEDTPPLEGTLNITIKKISEERLEVEFKQYLIKKIRKILPDYLNSGHIDSDSVNQARLDKHTEVLQGLYNQLKNSSAKLYVLLRWSNYEEEYLSPDVHLLLKEMGYEFQVQKIDDTYPHYPNIYEYKYVGSHLESDVSRIIEAADFRSFLGIPASGIMVKSARNDR